MTSYALRRLALAAPTLFIIVTLSFFLMHLAPGGPFDAEASLEPEVIANLEAAYDLDKPIIVQYGLYLGKVARGDFGPSIVYIDRTVTELLTIGLPVSLKLGISAMILALVIGCSLGIVAALHRNSSTDYAVMGVAMTGIAVPSFVMAPLMSLLFGVILKILPVASLEPRGGLAEAVPMLAPITPYIMPVIALALPQIAILARLTRGAMIETLRQNYIRTARAKGLAQRNVVWTHALKAASLPVISYLGPAAASIITGSVVIEQIFQLPGMGRFFIQGAINRDYPLVLGIVVVYALAVILLNLIVDLMYGLLDPKVKVE
ncbi:MAG: ABC transporter permease subunit [Rhodospirillaceae bacterium]|jgi:oligopeptide transport system permease protein|nr:ABC transporter permease subunit [Rhodospirillaceae bacterium]MBT5241261.1 ABC transporter permease subunit [Rhodospirillaceae bacterium]MBT5565104.1 ABC transporter permease subunit [Rhodospirillaceae bacterium]MBT6088126.1 ABC transporter permease subunit [Rhodospirillaceae bacterium]